MELVAAIPGNEIRIDAAAGNLHRYIGVLIGNLLHQGVVDVDLNLAVRLRSVHHHAVELIGIAPGWVAVRDHIGLLDLLGSAHVGLVEVDAGRIGAHGLWISRGGKRVHIVARQDRGVRHIVDVDSGNPSFHSHRFPHRARLHGAVDGYRHVGRKLDLLPYGRESCHSERDRVGAGTNIHDGIASLAVGGDDA